MLRRPHDPAIESIRAALKGLRTRSGLTVERLGSTELGLDSLLDLDVVRQLERTQQLSPNEAVVAAVRGTASQLDVPDMLIVDAALALGLVADPVPGAEGLYGPDLSQRRHSLVASWAALHEALGADVGPEPTIRSLRTDLELQAFERLAERILGSSPLDAVPEGTPVVAADAPADRAVAHPTVGPRDDGRPRVLVVGGAVMDHVLAVDRVPEPGTSVQAASYEALPGGKGLNQAIAAARLGMEAHLLAILGDDENGRRLHAYLQDEGVEMDLVRVIPGGRTPMTTVVVTPDGQAASIGWTDPIQVGVNRQDVHSRSTQAVVDAADAVLVTFEVASTAVEAALGLAATSAHAPKVLLTPSPPYAGPRFGHASLKYVDYLIGTSWELGCLVPGPPVDTPAEQLARQLLVLGAGAVCVAEQFGCLVRSDALDVDVPAFPAAFAEAAGARDAFAAALALRIHESDEDLSAFDVTWATAAMAASQSPRGVSSSMPSREEVDRVMSLASPGVEGHR